MTPQQVAEKERHIAEVIEAVTERVTQSPTKPLSQGQSRKKREKTPVSDIPKSDRELRSHSRQMVIDEEVVVPSTPEVQMKELTPEKESPKLGQPTKRTMEFVPKTSAQSIEMIDLTQER